MRRRKSIGNGESNSFTPVSTAIAIVADGFQEDLITCIKSIRDFTDTPIYIETSGKENQTLCEPIAQFAGVVTTWQKNKLGWGHSVNKLLTRIDSKYVVIMDPSTQFAGDAIMPTIAKFAEGYKAVGWRGGLVNLADDWRSTEDKGVGEVDVLFSYFMAFDREFILDVGGANPSATYYRNADIEMSLAIRENGGKLLQIDLPLMQGRHHGYHDVNPEYREKNSKKNYQRILERFRGREDILAPRR